MPSLSDNTVPTIQNLNSDWMRQDSVALYVRSPDPLSLEIEGCGLRNY